MQNVFSKFQQLMVGVGVLALLSACGGRLETRNRNAVQGDPAGQTVTTVDNTEALKFAQPQLQCVLVIPAAAAKIGVFVDGSDNFYPGYEPPPFPLTVIAGRSNARTSFDSFVLVDPQGIRPEGNTLKNADGSQTAFVRGLRLGVLNISVKITQVTPQATETALCQANFAIEGSRPLSPTVIVRANAFTGTLAPALSTGEKVGISWASVNTRACTLLQNGVPAVNVNTSGDILSPPLTNAGPAVFNQIFTVTCFGVGSTETTSASVVVPVNPPPTVTFRQVGGSNVATVAYGSNVDVEWTSQFAASCALSEGANSQIVTVNGTYKRLNAIANTTLTLTCRDRFQGMAQASVQINVVPLKNCAPSGKFSIFSQCNLPRQLTPYQTRTKDFVLPVDARNISIIVDTADVDDNNPSLSIGGSLIWSKSESEGLNGRTGITVNKDISAYVKAGATTISGTVYDKNFGECFAIEFNMHGTYQAAVCASSIGSN